jgi:DNA polymerase III subunit delta'
MMLPWHKSAFEKLKKMIDQNHLPHALLITGAPQIGKFELMQHLVQTLLCQDQSCGQCTLCRAIAKDNPKEVLDTSVLIRRSHYPNMVYCRTEVNDKGVESKNIRIDQIRAFCDALNKTADDLQIGVLFYADQMNVSAANSLLKTLEEPRDNTLIILLAHNPKNLPATILSRCQSVHIAPAYDEQTQLWLESHISDTQNKDFDVPQLLGNTHGVPFKVLSELSGDGFIHYQSWQNQLLNIAIHPAAINQVQDFEGNEVEVLDCLQNLVIEGIRLKSSKHEGGLVELNQIIKTVKTDFLFRLLDDIYHAISLSKTSVNIKLLLDNILIVWSHITRLQRYPQITKT